MPLKSKRGPSLSRTARVYRRIVSRSDSWRRAPLQHRPQQRQYFNDKAWFMIPKQRKQGN
jgi:hypothetical protein